jgi:formate hydrogenlyase subunit 3/multisubunit Na+/H+ antiporter MnhD subunit
MILTLLLLPLGAAVVAWIVRKAALIAAPISAAACFAVAFIAVTSQPQQPLVILGRSLELAPRAAAHLGLFAALTALVLLVGFRIPHGEMAWPLALVSLVFFAATLMARSPTIAALLLAAGGIAAAMLVPDVERETAAIASRALTLIVIASALLLVVVWSAETQSSDQGDLFLTDSAALALAFSLAVFLGQFPFFVWLPPIYGQASPLATTVLGVCLSTTALLRFGQIQMWALPLTQLLLSNVLTVVGVATCVVGCVGAVAQRRVGRILAYAAMADLGIVLLGVALRRPGGAEAAMLHLAYRNVAVVLVSMASGVLRRCFGSDEREYLHGAARRAPLAVIGLMIGGLSLAGLPPAAGFASRFALYRLLVTEMPVWTVAIALASLGPAWGFARIAIAAMGSAPLPGSQREPLAPGIVMLLLSLALLAVGLAPQWVTMVGAHWLDLLLQPGISAGI